MQLVKLVKIYSMCAFKWQSLVLLYYYSLHQQLAKSQLMLHQQIEDYEVQHVLLYLLNVYGPYTRIMIL